MHVRAHISATIRCVPIATTMTTNHHYHFAQYSNNDNNKQQQATTIYYNAMRVCSTHDVSH